MYISAIKRLIAIKCIQNKIKMYIMYVCVLCIFKDTHIYSIYFENIDMYILIFI